MSTRLRSDLILLLVAVLWGTAFIAQRIAAQHVNLYMFNGLRFTLASGFLIPFLMVRRNPVSRQIGRETKLGIILAGMILFVGAALQQAGLRSTTAGNAGFITGLYVVFVPLLSAMLLKNRPRMINILAALIAAIGLFLLSTGGTLSLAPGDLYELGGAILWAIHVILIGSLAQKAHPLRIATGQNIVCGGLSLTFASINPDLNRWKGLADNWWTVVYTGLFSVGLGYTLQIVAQRDTQPTDAAVILSMEAVVAALAGWLILDERLSAIQGFGCLLMLGAMIMAQIGGESYSGSREFKAETRASTSDSEL